MESLDPAEERRRLEEQYRQMSEGELRALADRGYELIHVTQEVLRAEISRRRLDIQLRMQSAEDSDAPDRDADLFAAPDPDQVFYPDLVLLREVRDESEARRVKAALDAAGVLSFWGPDNVDNLEELKSGFDAGVDVRVRKDYRARAYKAVNEIFPPGPEDDIEDDREYVAHCPKCHSPEIVFQGLDPKPVGEGIARDSKFDWRCDACGHRWEDEGIEQE